MIKNILSNWKGLNITNGNLYIIVRIVIIIIIISFVLGFFLSTLQKYNMHWAIPIIYYQRDNTRAVNIQSLKTNDNKLFDVHITINKRISVFVVFDLIWLYFITCFIRITNSPASRSSFLFSFMASFPLLSLDQKTLR